MPNESPWIRAPADEPSLREEIGSPRSTPDVPIVGRIAPPAPARVAVWLTSDQPGRVAQIGRAFAARLRERIDRVALLPEDLAAPRRIRIASIPSPDLTRFLEKAAEVLLRSGIFVVIAEPRADVLPSIGPTGPSPAVLEVHVRTEGSSEDPRPEIPFISRRVEQGRIVERVSPANPHRPAVIISRVPDSPDEAADVILDTLVRSGWLNPRNERPLIAPAGRAPRIRPPRSEPNRPVAPSPAWIPPPAEDARPTMRIPT